ncbi:MAG: serine hydrolase domain-containing protein [Gammaproteobacteria bacterium]|jgi:D-alanyl-D-alanine carboxypeptidase
MFNNKNAFLLFKIIAIIIVMSMFTASYAASVSPTNLKIQEALDNCRSKYKVPGLQASISLPAEYTTRDFESGTTTVGGSTTITTGHLFQIGSITKSFVSAIILQLEAEGKLRIDDPISKYIDFSKFPSWPSWWQNVTIKQLLNMTSGIYDYTEDQAFMDAIIADPAKLWTPFQLVDVAAKHAGYFKPGKGWEYSNTDYILAGMIIGKVTGKTVEQVMDERLLGSIHLNLLNTYYNDGNYPADIVNRTVHGYLYLDGTLKDVSSPNTSWVGAAGGMLANTRDIVRWVRACFSGQATQPQQLAEMKSLVCSGEDSNCIPGYPVNLKIGGYGLGLAEFDIQPFGEVWFYEGGTLGFNFYYMWLPLYNTVISVAGNECKMDDYSGDYLGSVALDILNILYTSPEWQQYRISHKMALSDQPINREKIIKKLKFGRHIIRHK